MKTFFREIFQSLRVLTPNLVLPVRKKLVSEFENSADTKYSIPIIAYSNIKGKEEDG